MTVHVLDPDVSTRSRLSSYLARRGLAVTEAGDLRETEEMCRERPPRAIVTELVGHPEELFLRLQAAAPSVPILIWTACPCAVTLRAARNLGAALLTKPSDVSAVAFVLGRLVVQGAVPGAA